MMLPCIYATLVDLLGIIPGIMPGIMPMPEYMLMPGYM